MYRIFSGNETKLLMGILCLIFASTLIYGQTDARDEEWDYLPITTGKAVIGQQTHNYAVIADPTHWPFFHIRIWLGGDRIMMVTPGMRPGEEDEMAHQIYSTQGRHWTLDGGKDETEYWTDSTSGEIKMDDFELPVILPPQGIPDDIPILTVDASGRGRQTHKAHEGAGTKWVSLESNWYAVQFRPTGVNQDQFDQWRDWIVWFLSGQMGNQPIQPVNQPSMGRVWEEFESGWNAVWTRRGQSNVFDAVWKLGARQTTALLTIQIQGNQVLIKRQNSSDGNNCVYRGLIMRNGVNVTGTYTCSSSGPHKWRAVIKQ